VTKLEASGKVGADGACPTVAQALALLANLLAFTACAALAYYRNIDGLFHGFDGMYMLVETLNRPATVQPAFAFSNDFLQSIGNIQLLQNPLLQFYFWPVGWFDDLKVAKVVVYLLIAVMMFASVYSLARLLSQGRLTALVAGWVVGIVATPVVPIPFFYPILSVAPSAALLVVFPVVGFGLLRLAGRSSWVADGLAALGLLGLVLYFLSAGPASFTLFAPGAIPYVALALLLSDRRSERIRKLLVLAVIVAVAVGLRWPWYLLGLFSNTSAHLFPDDFTTIYRDPVYVSILFQGSAFGWAGPAFVAASVVGALLSLRRGAEELRVAAWVLLATIATLLIAVAALFVVKDWILPAPIYVEIAFWPLYAVFAAVALCKSVELAVTRLAAGRLFADSAGRAAWLLPMPAAAAAALLAASRPPTTFASSFPPRSTEMVDVLKANIALFPGSRFNGRVATIIPVEANGEDAWVQQVGAAYKLWRATGNDHMTLGLWYSRIPTLFEYNQFLSPVFHALVKRTLQQPALPHQRNITILSHANIRVLKLLGVRYAILPQEDSPLGRPRATENVAGQPWGLFELPDANLATYSPTSVEVRGSLASTLDFVADDGIDLAKSAVVREEIGGFLVPVQSSSLTMSGGDLRVAAHSTGRSLLVVPLEFSRCIEVEDLRAGSGGPGPTLVRVDGLLTGVVFERDLDAVLAFRTGPLRNPTCRWQDYQDVRTMLR
jgi:hypothetical protein